MNWIKVSEELPEKHLDVFVWVNGTADVAFLNNKSEWFSFFMAETIQNVTHWAYIEPPMT